MGPVIWAYRAGLYVSRAGSIGGSGRGRALAAIGSRHSSSCVRDGMPSGCPQFNRRGCWLLGPRWAAARPHGISQLGARRVQLAAALHSRLLAIG